MGYIYIAFDSTKPELSKIGLTTKSAESRISQTENPDYQLYYKCEVPDENLRETEARIHQFFEQHYKRKKHLSTGRNSEWFECPPQKAKYYLENGKISGLTLGKLKSHEPVYRGGRYTAVPATPPSPKKPFYRSKPVTQNNSARYYLAKERLKANEISKNEAPKKPVLSTKVKVSILCLVIFELALVLSFIDTSTL